MPTGDVPQVRKRDMVRMRPARRPGDAGRPEVEALRLPSHAFARRATLRRTQGQGLTAALVPGCSARLLANENECQLGDDERRQEQRQEPLARASEQDGLAVGGVEGLSSA